MLLREGPTESQSWVFGDIKPFFFFSCFSILSPLIAGPQHLVESQGELVWLGRLGPMASRGLHHQGCWRPPGTQAHSLLPPWCRPLFLSIAKCASIFFPYGKKTNRNDVIEDLCHHPTFSSSIFLPISASFLERVVCASLCCFHLFFLFNPSCPPFYV